MKVLHICMSQYSDGWTYQENMLAKFHKLDGYDVTILTSMYCYHEGKLVEDNKNEFIDCNGCQVIRLKRYTDGFMRKMPRYKEFLATIQRIEPDIIFSHGCQYVDIKEVRNYVRAHSQVKLFIDNHADFSNSATNWFSKNILHKVIWKHYAKIIEPCAQKFWGVLPARVDFLTEVYGLPENKCDLLVMGGDDDLVEKANQGETKWKLRQRYGINTNDFLIVTGGKIDKAKSETLLLMEAVKEIENPNVKLLVFGSIDRELKEMADALTVENKVQQVGWIDASESYRYFAAADLVVFPGRHSVFWEQVAAQGIPMIVKEWKGIDHIDVCGNTKFIKEVSVPSLKESILELESNSVLYKRIKSNAVRAMSQFSYREISRKSIC